MSDSLEDHLPLKYIILVFCQYARSASVDNESKRYPKFVPTGTNF